MLQSKIDLNIVDKSGRTPLHKAAIYGYLSLMENLLAKGANLEVQDNEGNYPIHLAVTYGQTTIIEYLVENYPAILSVRNWHGWTAICIAIAKRREDIFQYLVKKGAALHVVDVLERTWNISKIWKDTEKLSSQLSEARYCNIRFQSVDIQGYLSGTTIAIVPPPDINDELKSELCAQFAKDFWFNDDKAKERRRFLLNLLNATPDRPLEVKLLTLVRRIFATFHTKIDAESSKENKQRDPINIVSKLILDLLTDPLYGKSRFSKLVQGLFLAYYQYLLENNSYIFAADVKLYSLYVNCKLDIKNLKEEIDYETFKKAKKKQIERASKAREELFTLFAIFDSSPSPKFLKRLREMYHELNEAFQNTLSPIILICDFSPIKIDGELSDDSDENNSSDWGKSLAKATAFFKIDIPIKFINKSVQKNIGTKIVQLCKEHPTKFPSFLKTLLSPFEIPKYRNMTWADNTRRIMNQCTAAILMCNSSPVDKRLAFVVLFKSIGNTVSTLTKKSHEKELILTQDAEQTNYYQLNLSITPFLHCNEEYSQITWSALDKLYNISIQKEAAIIASLELGILLSQALSESAYNLVRSLIKEIHNKSKNTITPAIFHQINDRSFLHKLLQDHLQQRDNCLTTLGSNFLILALPGNYITVFSDILKDSIWNDKEKLMELLISSIVILTPNNLQLVSHEHFTKIITSTLTTLLKFHLHLNMSEDTYLDHLNKLTTWIADIFLAPSSFHECVKHYELRSLWNTVLNNIIKDFKLDPQKCRQFSVVHEPNSSNIANDNAGCDNENTAPSSNGKFFQEMRKSLSETEDASKQHDQFGETAESEKKFG